MFILVRLRRAATLYGIGFGFPVDIAYLVVKRATNAKPNRT
jgi:hypothetical protein